MKIDNLRPWEIKDIIGGDTTDPNCWPNPDDDPEPLYPGGPIITIPGLPTIPGT